MNTITYCGRYVKDETHEFYELYDTYKSYEHSQARRICQIQRTVCYSITPEEKVAIYAIFNINCS